MKVWITKYALTKGILKNEKAEICADINGNMIEAGDMGYYHKGNYPLTSLTNPTML